MHDAALVHWKEAFNATGETPMTVTITISAAIQVMKGVTWIKPRRESKVPPDENTARKKEGQKVDDVVEPGGQDVRTGSKGFTFTKTAAKHFDDVVTC